MSQCLVSINHLQTFLLPRKQALQLVDLFVQAKQVHERFAYIDDDDKCAVLEAPHVQLKTIDKNRLIYNKETTKKGTTP